jgi:hypothetical protein
MFITSLGIFGFLSKAHIDSNIDVGDVSIQLKTLQEQEKIVKERLNYLIKRAGDNPEKISKQTDNAIQATQKELIEIQQKKLPLQKQENQLMAEVGPLKYIAQAIYGNDAESHFDSAVRFVIIMLIFVFDPLAVLLVIAANFTLRQHHIAKLPIPREDIPFSRKMPQKEYARRKKKIDLTSLDPIPMTKDEVEKKTNLFER